MTCKKCKSHPLFADTTKNRLQAIVCWFLVYRNKNLSETSLILAWSSHCCWAWPCAWLAGRTLAPVTGEEAWGVCWSKKNDRHLKSKLQLATKPDWAQLRTGASLWYWAMSGWLLKSKLPRSERVAQWGSACLTCWRLWVYPQHRKQTNQQMA
jgi:hypothetical protein